jgi:pilus assembly protein Flp/PilA
MRSGGRGTINVFVEPLLHRLWARDEGQAMVEYAMILFLVALVVIVILAALGGNVSSMLSVVSNKFP